jgi:hypothetical protein
MPCAPETNEVEYSTLLVGPVSMRTLTIRYKKEQNYREVLTQ